MSCTVANSNDINRTTLLIVSFISNNTRFPDETVHPISIVAIVAALAVRNVDVMTCV